MKKHTRGEVAWAIIEAANLNPFRYIAPVMTRVRTVANGITSTRTGHQQRVLSSEDVIKVLDKLDAMAPIVLRGKVEITAEHLNSARTSLE